jgi:hypothetical protein
MTDWTGSHLQKLDELQAFDAMRAFLEAYWALGGKRSDDLAVLLGRLNRDVEQNTPPLDPALWHDWRDAVAGLK